MNKLINDFNRGFSLKNDDLRFVDASVRLALADITSALSGSGGACILWGCDIAYIYPIFIVSAGAIYYEGEVWHVYEHTFSMPDPNAQQLLWCFRTSNDAAGAKIDNDMGTHQAYQVRDCILDNNGSRAGMIGSISAWKTPLAGDFFFGKGEAPVTYNYGAITAPGSTVLAIKVNGVCTLTGSISASVSGGSGENHVILPAGYRPKFRISGYVAAKVSGSPDAMPIQLSYEIRTNGDICFRASDGGGAYVIDLGSLSFAIA